MIFSIKNYILIPRIYQLHQTYVTTHCPTNVADKHTPEKQKGITKNPTIAINSL
jgi:hypothetical protein